MRLFLHFTRIVSDVQRTPVRISADELSPMNASHLKVAPSSLLVAAKVSDEEATPDSVPCVPVQFLPPANHLNWGRLFPL